MALVVLLVVISGLVGGLIYVSNSKAPMNQVAATRTLLTQAPATRAVSQPAQIPTTQNNAGYTATNIIKDLCNAGQNDVCDSGRVSYGGSLWSFSNYTIQTDVNPASSAQFVDTSRCQTSCAYSEIQPVWIGVYSSVDDMTRVFNEVLNQADNAQANGTINQINGSRDGTLPMMQSGRCLNLWKTCNTILCIKCTDPIRLDTFCIIVSSYRADLTAPASIGFQTRQE